MAARGYAIQVVVSEAWRNAAVVTHIASSVLFTLGILAHLVLMWRYLRALRDETFCTQVRMKDRLGLDSGSSLRHDTEPSSNRSGETDERDSTERDLAEVGRPAG